jgi:polysaccharide deacetylase 2 family uncharacterized protein YibQ
VQTAGTENKTISPDTPLPPWKETFLARYSRNLKLSVTVAALIVLIAPWFLFGGHESKTSNKESMAQAPTKVQGAESKAAIPNPALSPVETLAAAAPASLAILNEQDDRTIKLPSAPDGGLTEDTAEGSLPRIGVDGRQPWQFYARPFNAADGRPRIAIIIAGLGLSRVETDAAIARLPANVTLAFDVQSRVIGAWCARARQDGHETLLTVPMEPFDYPRSDPGPNTLLTTLPNTDKIQRLLWALGQASGYVGITTLSGSRFTTDPQKLDPIIDMLKKRGLMVVDTRVAPHSAVADVATGRHVPVAVTTEQLDQNLAPDAIDAAFEQLEKTAHLTGQAIGITAPEPIMLDRLQSWLKTLPQHGIALAPVSAMAK